MYGSNRSLRTSCSSMDSDIQTPKSPWFIQLIGVVSVSNSLVGNQANDNVGTWGTALIDGSYVVGSPCWTWDYHSTREQLAGISQEVVCQAD